MRAVAGPARRAAAGGSRAVVRLPCGVRGLAQPAAWAVPAARVLLLRRPGQGARAASAGAAHGLCADAVRGHGCGQPRVRPRRARRLQQKRAGHG